MLILKELVRSIFKLYGRLDKEKKSMTKNYVHHICIQTNTYLETLEFYIKALGFEIVEESPNFHGREFNTWL